MNCHISVLLNATGDEERFWRYRASTILPLFEECNPKAYDLSVAGMAYLAAPIREHSPPTSYPPADQRQADTHFQSSGSCIPEKDVSAMAVYDALSDSQSQANTAGCAIARLLQTIVGKQHIAEEFLGNARAIISNPHHQFGRDAFELDPGRGCIFDRVIH